MRSKLTFIHAFIINPLLNLYPLMWLNIFHDNMTYAANTLHHPFYVILWAFSTALGCYYYSKRIWQAPFFKFQNIIHALLCAGMVITPFIPYSLTLPVQINDLHIWLGMVSVGGFIAEWFFYFILYGLPAFWDRIFLYTLIFCVTLAFLPGSITASAQLSFSLLVNMLLRIHKKNED